MRKIIEGDEEKHVPITTNSIMTQKLVNYTPRFNVGCAVIFLAIFTVLFIVFGIPIVVQSRQIKEIIVDFTTW